MVHRWSPLVYRQSVGRFPHRTLQICREIDHANNIVIAMLFPAFTVTFVKIKFIPIFNQILVISGHSRGFLFLYMALSVIIDLTNTSEIL